MELRDLFRNLVKMAAIDKKFAPEEISFLAQRAEGWGIPEGELENALAEVPRETFRSSSPKSVPIAST